MQTSGTTAEPCIVSLSAENVCCAAQNISSILKISTADRCLGIMPFVHIHGLSTIFASIVAGASIICVSKFSVESFCTALSNLQPTWCSAAPTMYQAILQQTNITEIKHSLRFLRTASAPMPPDLIEKLESVFLAPVIEAYGMTEAAPQIASNCLPPKTRKKGSVGQAAGPEVKIANENGILLSANKEGEIIVRGKNIVSKENYIAPSNRWLKDDWLRTGDSGYLDDDGYLFITGRLKEVINRGGEKVSPWEVEKLLVQVTEVSDAACFALPHLTLGETVAAAIVVKNNSDKNSTLLRLVRVQNTKPLTCKTGRFDK